MSFTIVLARYTLDTNILIYAADHSARPQKRSQSQQLIRTAANSRQPLALQSLHEFCQVATRKRLLPLTGLRDLMEQYTAAFEMIMAGEQDLFDAFALHERSRYSYFDCLLLTTSHRAGCSIFFSEDMQDGYAALGMEIVNPFTRSSEVLEALLKA